MIRDYEYFINMMVKYYQTETDLDIYDDADTVYVLSDFAEKSAVFINYIVNRDDEEYWIITEKGKEYLEKLERIEELEEKFNNETILLWEYHELEKLKAEIEN